MAEQKWYDGKPHWPYPKNGGKFPSPWWPYPKKGGKQGFDQNVKDAVSMITDGDAIAKEFIDIAVAHGYAGPQEGLSVQEAIDALTDTLAGTDVDSGDTIAEAVRALAPYIGAGGSSQRVELFNETVTTVDEGRGFNEATLAYTGSITADPLVVSFDGTEYELPRSEVEGIMGTTVTYGTPLTEDGPDFSTYPLVIESSLGGRWRVFTETAGTHTIVAYADSATPTPTLGPLQAWPYISTDVPAVGSSITALNNYSNLLGLSVGETTICTNAKGRFPNMFGEVASGVTIHITSDIGTIDNLYAVVVAADQTISSVRELDIDVNADFSTNSNVFVMPELEEGEVLYIKYSGGLT